MAKTEPIRKPNRQELFEEIERLRHEVGTLRAQSCPASSEPSAPGPHPSKDTPPADFFRRVLDGLPAQAAVLGTDLRYLYINPAALGDSELRRWIIGRNDHEYCRRRNRDPAVAVERDHWRRRAIAERRTLAFEEEIITPDGETRYYLRLHSPLIGPDGSVDQLIAYGLDITERKQLELQLQQVQRLEAVGQLAGGVAHDFNNLLTTILGYAQILGQQLPQNSPGQHCAQEIEGAGQRAALLVRQLLAFSRKQVLQVRLFDLNRILTAMQGLLHSTLGENVDLRLELSPVSMALRADPLQMEQVVLNLAVNARDAMPRGGAFSITTSTVEEAPKEGDKGHEGRHHLLTVTDSGCGMDTATLQKIFEPFFTTKELGKGTGLGLSTVYGIVQQSEGQIRVTSTEGKGTTFEIFLPAVDKVLPEDHEKPREPVSPGSETVLVAEDESSVRELVCEMLRSVGYRVLEAVDGREALEVAATHDGPIHLLATDVVMPLMGGLELAQILLRQRPKTRVLFMSGYAHDDAARRDLEDAPFIAKPFRPYDLREKVREVLDTEDPAQAVESLK
jgi:signal transduction histidine kinase/CheY-like chemotaxis protein